MQQTIDKGWGQRLIRSWNEGWFTLPEQIGDKIARLLGAKPDEIIVADSTSVNLFKLALAALQAQPNRHKIITDDLNFPSDLYVLQGRVPITGWGSYSGHSLARWHSWPGGGTGRSD